MEVKRFESSIPSKYWNHKCWDFNYFLEYYKLQVGVKTDGEYLYFNQMVSISHKYLVPAELLEEFCMSYFLYDLYYKSCGLQNGIFDALVNKVKAKLEDVELLEEFNTMLKEFDEHVNDNAIEQNYNVYADKAMFLFKECYPNWYKRSKETNLMNVVKESVNIDDYKIGDIVLFDASQIEDLYDDELLKYTGKYPLIIGELIEYIDDNQWNKDPENDQGCWRIEFTDIDFRETVYRLLAFPNEITCKIDIDSDESIIEFLSSYLI